MEEKRVADYFVVAGLAPQLEPLDDVANEDFLKADTKQEPIVDIAVILRGLGEPCPPGYKCIEFTPSGHPADLNHGSLRAPEVYLCYRKGRDKPPITDLGVLYEGKERVMEGCEVVHTTPFGRPANVNNTNSSRILVTYRRADDTAASDTLSVIDICVILGNKGEVPPHAFNQIPKNLNKGMMGSDVFLCYKKSMTKANMLAFKADILSRYPAEDIPNFPLPPTVPMFCLPLGATIESCKASARKPKPVFSTFVLTGADNEKVYGAAVMFYEPYDRSGLNEEQQTQLALLPKPEEESQEESEEQPEEMVLHATKCICLLSRWPFFQTFKKFLKYLYRLSSSGSHPVPIERHISHFMTEVPFPSPQRPRILVQLSDDVILLSQPEETPLSRSGASFIKLLKNLGPENCLNLLVFALVEHKILIHSLRPDVLTSVAEALVSIIFPFHWECPYIPLCPLSLADVLHAPCPYIVGVDSRFFDTHDPPVDVTCVDLDTNTITPSEDRKGVTYKLLPKRPLKVLKGSLERLYDRLCQEPSEPNTPEEVGLDLTAIDQDFNRARKELIMETKIQEAFVRFTAAILKGYDNFLLPITEAPTSRTTDLSSLYDVTAFLKSRDKSYHKFFTQFMRTQMFSRFIEVRSFVSDKDTGLAFFDECCSKVDENREEPHLIDLDDSHRSERTVFIYPPEPIGLPEGATYSYTTFPELNADLFQTHRPPSLLSTPLKQTSACPNSPITRRTKQEIKSAQKVAQKHSESPTTWAKCLLAHCYSLWFIHLPAYVKSLHSKTKALRSAHEVLVKMQTSKLQPPDEVCYRVLVQLCGLYHQPALAVKVLMELKRNGVQPNAITYGYYNKVVLESKWPSGESNADILWRKLRNVVMAVAQFRQALRRRRLSMYSTSESDFDRISRESSESFPEDLVVDRHDGSKPEFVHDLVSVESPCAEERTSTGGMSDRGYSSMTSEDKRSSMAIGSQDSLDSLNKAIVPRHEGRNAEKPRAISRMHNQHRANICNGAAHKSAKEVGTARQLSFDTIDAKTEEAFQNHVRSIFRKSGSSIESGGTLRELGSSAGLLMTSRTSLDEELFGNVGLSHSLQSRDEAAKEGIVRKKSSGEAPPRRNSLQLEERQGNEGNETPVVADGAMDAALAQRLAAGEEGDKGESEAPSSTPQGHRTSELAHPIDTVLESDMESWPPDPTQNGLLIDPVSSTPAASQGAGDGASDGVTPQVVPGVELLQDMLSPLDGSTDTDAMLDTPEKSSLSASNPPLSPSHSVRTPVTENDPLGLFVSPQPITGQGDSGPNLESLLGSSHESSGGDAPSGSSDRANLLLDLPFSNTSTPVKMRRSVSDTTGASSDPTLSPDHPPSSPMGRAASLDTSESESPGSPEAWQPLSNTQPGPTTDDPDDTADSKRLDTPSRRKLAGRSESFSRAYKSAASLASKAFTASRALGSKLSNTMTPGKPSGGTASTVGRHTISPDSGKPLLEQDEDALSENSSSPEKAPQGGTDTPRGDDDTDANGRKISMRGYTPLMADLWDGLMANLPSNLPSLRSTLAQSLDSLKGAAGYGDTSMSTADSESATSSTPSRQPATSKLSLGALSTASTQSIPQTLFTVAMEVEMCSLSRCSACQSLLYDEEIMAGWSADDSNLNTTCQFCGSKLVPLLQIHVKDFRQSVRPHVLTPSHSSESMQSIHSLPNVQLSNALPSSTRHFTRSTASLAENVLVGGASQPPEAAVLSSHASADDVLVKDSEESSTAQSYQIKEGKLIDFENSPKKAPSVDSSSHTRARSISDNTPSSGEHTQEEVQGEVTDGAAATGKDTDSISQSSAHIDEDNASLNSANTEGTAEKENRRKFVVLEPITVPYLSPLVLRKEVETVVEQEGDLCLSSHEFLDLHPILYWNLVWYFQRLDVPTHLPGFVLHAKTTNINSNPHRQWASADSRHVLIRPLWDNLRMQTEMGLPMYKLWNIDSIFRLWVVNTMPADVLALKVARASAAKGKEPPPEPATDPVLEMPHFDQSVMDSVVESIKKNDVVSPLKLLMDHRRKMKKQRPTLKYRSMYRDILYLSFAALDRDNIDHDAFDREYRLALTELNPKYMAQMMPFDRAPKRGVYTCRHYFSALDL